MEAGRFGLSLLVLTRRLALAAKSGVNRGQFAVYTVMKTRKIDLHVVALGLALGIACGMANGQDAKPAAAPAAQTPAAEPAAQVPTLKMDARLVNLPVVVRDKKGALIQTLSKEQFALNVDGKAQTIRYFDRDTNLPLTLGLLVDASRSVASAIDDERAASGTFLETMLTSDKDRAFVIQFAREVELLQDTTNSKPKLQRALKELGTQAPSNNNDRDASGDDAGSQGGNRRRGGGGTTLYDAAFLAADELMSKQQGRKALVLLTDGEDRGSKESIASAIEAAQRADTIVYAIYFKGEEEHGEREHGGGSPGGGRRSGGGIGFPGGGYPGGGGGYPGGGGGGGRRGGGQGGGGREPHVDGKKILERMTSETGGRMFEINKHQTVAQIYDQIAEELRAQYRLGFTPNADTAAEGYHQVALTVPQGKNLSVQTREGYYSK